MVAVRTEKLTTIFLFDKVMAHRVERYTKVETQGFKILWIIRIEVHFVTTTSCSDNTSSIIVVTTKVTVALEELGPFDGAFEDYSFVSHLESPYVVGSVF